MIKGGHHSEETKQKMRKAHEKTSIDGRSSMKKLSILNSREKDILIARLIFGLSLREVGKNYGISKERIRQINWRTIRKLGTESIRQYRKYGKRREILNIISNNLQKHKEFVMRCVEKEIMNLSEQSLTKRITKLTENKEDEKQKQTK